MLPADSPFAPLPAPGPHPAPAELRAYAAGTLPPADEHRIEAHALDCERCADLVAGFSMSDAATTDHAVAALRTRLQARIGAEEPTPVSGGWAWPRLAAAAALLAAVAGGVWTLEQRKTPPAPATARLETTAPKVSAAPPAAKPAAPSAPEVAHEAAVASGNNNPADYAAVAPAQARRRAAPRPLSRNSQADDAFADRAALADREAAPEPAGRDEAQQIAAAPVAAASAALRDAAAYPSAAAAPARKSERLLAGRAAVLDSAALLGEVAGASRMPKAKASAPGAAPATVANTPMPAAPAINPAPVSGSTAFREYLRREASRFEPEINNLRLSGTVRIRFVVGADGKLNDLKVTRSLRPDYDEEALRLVCEGPAWQPGVAAGKRAPLPVEVTVPF